MARTLKKEFGKIPDPSKPDEIIYDNIIVNDANPYGTVKDDTSNSQKGTPINEKSIGDIRQFIFAAMVDVGMIPNENPENINNHQFVQSLDARYRTIGKIEQWQNEPPKNKRLLKLDGKTIDLSDPKYADFKDYIEKNETFYDGTNGKDKFTIFVDDATDADRWKYKRHKGNANLLTLPKPAMGDAMIINADANHVGRASDGNVAKHRHNINAFNMSTNVYGSFTIDISHSHNNNLRYRGYIDSYLFMRAATANRFLFIDANANIGSEMTALNRTNLVTGAFYFIKSASSLRYPYNNKRDIVYTWIGRNNMPQYGLRFDTRRSGAKFGGVLNQDININKNIQIPAATIPFADTTTSIFGNSNKNLSQGSNTLWYVVF